MFFQHLTRLQLRLPERVWICEWCGSERSWKCLTDYFITSISQEDQESQTQKSSL
jgi:hypothetical protein